VVKRYSSELLLNKAYNKLEEDVYTLEVLKEALIKSLKEIIRLITKGDI